MKMPLEESNGESTNKWASLMGSLAISAIGHPIEYAKVLIQIGHEPIPPKPATTLLGKPVLALPNAFQYVGYIKSVDGIAGCFRGLSAKICGNLVNAAVMQISKEKFQEKKRQQGGKLWLQRPDDMESAKEIEFAEKLLMEIAQHTLAVIASHPFQVISVRMMAEFVGGEKYHQTIWLAIREVYRSQGLSGFYSGLIPRLLGDLATVILVSFLGMAVSKALPDGEEMRNYASAIAGFIATAITYPFNVVSNCMIVSSSGLVAGTSPRMPHYSSWLHCWGHLRSQGQLKRGSALIWRYYRGPYVLVNGQPVMVAREELQASAKLR